MYRWHYFGTVFLNSRYRFCTKHGKKERTSKPVPSEMTNVAKIVIPKLIIRFIYYLRNKHQGRSDTNSLFFLSEYPVHWCTWGYKPIETMILHNTYSLYRIYVQIINTNKSMWCNDTEQPRTHVCGPISHCPQCHVDSVISGDGNFMLRDNFTIN